MTNEITFWPQIYLLIKFNSDRFNSIDLLWLFFNVKYWIGIVANAIIEKQRAAIKYGGFRPTRLSTGCNATQDRISTIAEIVNDTEYQFMYMYNSR
jgi:hypothetical protein